MSDERRIHGKKRDSWEKEEIYEEKYERFISILEKVYDEDTSEKIN